MDHQRHLRGRGPRLPFNQLWDSTKPYLGLIVGFHDTAGKTVYGKITECREDPLGKVLATVTHKNGEQTAHHLAGDTPMRVLTQRKCPWCCEMFYPHHQDQRHCSPRHEEAQELKGLATRKLLQDTCRRLGVTCLHPWKQSYASQASALTGAKNARRQYGTRLEPYMCVCDRWHLGHPTSTPRWRDCGTVDPTVEDLARFLSSRGVDTGTPRFQRAARESLAAYRRLDPENVLAVA